MTTERPSATHAAETRVRVIHRPSGLRNEGRAGEGARLPVGKWLLALGLAGICALVGGLQHSITLAEAAPAAHSAGFSDGVFASGFEAADIALACQSAAGRDRDGDGLIDPTCVQASASPDPATIAAPIDPTVPADFETANVFLYQHPTPVQHGMLDDVIEPYRVAVLRGEIRDENGDPLAGVLVRVLNHPEVGYTFTRDDGMFDIVVNGGSEVVLDYRKPGYLPAQRSAVAPWRDWEWVPDATLVPIDPVVTRIVTGGQMPRQLIRSSVVTDGDGIREAVLLVPPAITAELRMHDGSTRVMTELNVRATEYTVGERGPNRMPAALPPTSAYTYAVDFSADEALAANARSVEFNQPLAFYLDNFLQVPVGVTIPAGYLDARLASWLPSDDGRVIRILAINNGVAELDIEGNGQPATVSELGELGIDLGERTQLATLYPAGKDLWRTPIAHFTPWDCNFPYAPNPDDEPPPEGTDDDELDCDENCAGGDDDPNGADDDENTDENPETECGSLIRCEPASLQESIPVAGTSQALVYHSERVKRVAATQGRHTLSIKVTRDTVPPRLASARLEVFSLGKKYVSLHPSPSPNEIARILLEPVDAYGRAWTGVQTWKATLFYNYPPQYFGGRPNELRRAWATFFERGIPFTAFRSSSPLISLGRTWESRSRNVTARLAPADWDATGLGYGGWSLSGHHVLDRDAWKLYLGNGEQQRVALPGARGLPIAQTLIKRYGPDDLRRASRFAFAADGAVWVLARSENSPVPGSNGVWRYGFDGSRTMLVDLCSEAALECIEENFGYAGPDIPRDISVDSRGVAYVAAGSQVFEIGADGTVASRFDGASLAASCTPRRLQAWSDRVFVTCGSRLFAIWRDGQITHLAGGGNQTGVGVAPEDYAFGNLTEITVDPSGQIYVLDAVARTLFRIRTDGVIEPVAGNGTAGVPLDGAVAAEAPLGIVTALTMLPSGNPAYATGFGDYRLRELRGNGRVYTLVGGGEAAIGSLGGEQTLSAQLRFDVADIGILADGSIAFLQSNPNGELRKGSVSSVIGVVASSFITSFDGYAEDKQQGYRITSRDGAQQYLFDADGRHQSTRDVVTGATLMAFGYDPSGYLVSVTDGDGNQLSIERDGSHRATALQAQDGQRTLLAYDTAGRLESVTDPIQRQWQLEYLVNSGLLARFENPRGFASNFEWGGPKLVSDSNAESGSWTLTPVRWRSRDAYGTEMRTAEGRTNTYFVNNDPVGRQLRSVRRANGTSSVVRADREGVSTTTRDDRVIIEQHLAPDPRFGWGAPFLAVNQVSVISVATGEELARRRVTQTRVAAAPPGPPPDVGEFDLNFETSVNGRVYRRTYDALQRTWHMTTPQGRGASIRLDQQGRPLDVDAPALAQVRYRYDGRGRLVSVEAGSGPELRRFTVGYDGNGWPMTLVDAEQRSTLLEHDLIGRLGRQQTPDQRDIGFRYDPASNLVGLTPPGRDEHGFEYDKVDRVLSYSAPMAASAEGRQTAYSYSADGQLTQVLRPDGGAVTVTYSPLTGLPTGVSSPGSGTRAITLDGYGRLTAASHYAATFDGPLIRDARSALQTQASRVDQAVLFRYDNDFRIVSYAVLTNQGQTNVPATYAYDGDSLLNQLSFAGRTQSFTHHPGNGLLQGSTVGGFSEGWQHNVFAEPVAYASHRSGAAQLDFTYTRDRLGRITDVAETRAGITRATGYAYDLAGRLERVTRDGAEIASYDYDSNSNREQATYSGELATALTQCAPASGPITSDIDAQDRMTRYGTCTYAYTANGELTRRTDTATNAITTYVYDEFANLRSVTQADGTQIDYDIDGLNRRIGKRIDGQVTQTWLYKDQLNPIAEYDGNGALVSVFAYAERGHVPSLMLKAGSTYKIVSDHLGSVRQVIDLTTGTIAQALDYDAWGNMLLDTNPGFQPFGYAGGLYDQDTGLVRFGARDYDPISGRWTAKDPIRFRGGQANLYGYVHGDPINLIDRTGRSAEDIARLEQAFHEILQQMTNEGLRLPDPFENNMRAFYGDNDLMRCSDQSAEIIDRLRQRIESGELQLDDKWSFEFRDNLDGKPWFVPGHIWGQATSSNPADGVIQFDPRAGSYNNPPYAPWVR